MGPVLLGTGPVLSGHPFNQRPRGAGVLTNSRRQAGSVEPLDQPGEQGVEGAVEDVGGVDGAHTKCNTIDNSVSHLSGHVLG